MTTIYFIRHAESDISVRDGRLRPLTEKGMRDRALVTAFLKDKGIDAVLSSPFKRAVDTVADFAEKNGFLVETVEDFRERKSDSDWQRETDFWPFIERQWADFFYSLSDGECLAEVQDRNIAALNRVLDEYQGKTVAIGTHGTALSTIINHYDSSYGYADFMAMVKIMPWVVKMTFEGRDCAGMRKIDLFHLDQKPDYSKRLVYTADFGALKAYIYVVIFARYRGKWLYCRAQSRDTYETAGGHIEQGETPLQAARRELYEETGAIRFDIEPAFDYSVHIPTEYSNGQLYLAHIHELGELPVYDAASGIVSTAEVKLFDTIPGAMRFPQILPVLYERVKDMEKADSE